MRSHRALRTILFTDLVGSTGRAAELGDRTWRELLQRHHALVRQTLRQWGAREVNEAGDGFLAILDSPARGIACAAAIRDAVRALGLEVRCGLHMGEVEHAPDGSVGGIGVHIGARVAALAAPGEILVSRAVRDAEEGSGFAFEDRGAFDLKGIPGERHLYAVTALPEDAAGLALGRGERVASALRTRPKTVVIAAAITVILAAVLTTRGWMNRTANPSYAGEASIAVLPFENLGGDPTDDAFSDGITEDIITALAKVDDLKVISRSSSMQYRGRSADLQSVARELGVAAILEGSVRRSGDRVRITAQLIDATTDQHLWAETYDRRLTDVFEVQGAVAASIARALDATLTPAEQRRLGTRPTANLEAYEAYLKGMAHVSGFMVTEETIQEAQTLFETAIRLDPDFALAYAQLSRLHSLIYFIGFDATEARLEAARQALLQAVRRAPDLPETELASGYFHYYGSRDYDRAEAEFRSALSGYPNYADAYASLGYIYRRRGDWEQSVTMLEKAADLDPRNVRYLLELYTTYGSMRRYEEALGVIERGLSVNPGQFSVLKGFLYIDWKGDLEPLRQALAALPEGSRQALESYALHMLERDYEAAFRALESDPNEVYGGGDFFAPKAFLLGETFTRRYLQDAGSNREEYKARALEYYAAARRVLQKALAGQPDDPRWRQTLAWLYTSMSLLGEADAEDAIREMRRVVQLVPESDDAFWGAHYSTSLASIYAATGNKALALDMLERLVVTPGGPSRGALELYYDWDPLRDEPRFQALLADTTW